MGREGSIRGCRCALQGCAGLNARKGESGLNVVIEAVSGRPSNTREQQALGDGSWHSSNLTGMARKVPFVTISFLKP